MYPECAFERALGVAERIAATERTNELLHLKNMELQIRIAMLEETYNITAKAFENRVKRLMRRRRKPIGATHSVAL